MRTRHDRRANDAGRRPGGGRVLPVRRWMLAVALALVGLAGAAPAARAAESLTVAIVSRTVFYVPVWLAARRGYFRDEGLDVRIEVFDNAERIVAALRDGSVQLAMSPPEAVMMDALSGGPLRVVAGNAGRLPHFVITRPEIRTLADLRGRTVGVLSMQEGTTHLVPEVARSAGLGPNDYRVEAVGGAPTRQRLLREGRIDAGLQPFPLSYEAEAAGFNNLGPLLNWVPEWQFTAVNADLRWAEANRPKLVGALRAIRRGLDAIAADPDAAAAVAAAELNTTRELAARALADTARLGILTPGMAISEPGLARVHQALVASRLVPDAPFDVTRIADRRFLRESEDIVLRGAGTLLFGGTQGRIEGQPPREIRIATGAPPLRTDPNGTYQTGQAYAGFLRLAAPRGLPVLFLNGGTATGAMWETTPDGRPGWRDILLRAGHDTWGVDAPGKGRAAYQPFPAILPGEPVFRANEGSWTLLRMGPRYAADPAAREAFPGTQFPVEAFDTFMRGAVPRFAGQDDVELAAYEDLLRRIGPCVIVAQSSGAYFGLVLAARHPDLVRAVVAVELTAVPDLAAVDAAALARTPQLLVWGDYLGTSDYWRRTRAAADAYAAALRERGGTAEVLDLPARGIRGNTHQVMMDRNSEAVAELVLAWLSPRSRLGPERP